MTLEERGEQNYKTALEIISLLGVNKDEILRGLTDACSECDRFGPRDGKQCASLRLARDCGIEYTVPAWCKDKGEYSDG